MFNSVILTHVKQCFTKYFNVQENGRKEVKKMTTNVFSGPARTYYVGCLKFIKLVEKKYHRMPDILEIAKYIQEKFGDDVLLSDFRTMIAMLLIEEKISECLFYEGI